MPGDAEITAEVGKSCAQPKSRRCDQRVRRAGLTKAGCPPHPRASEARFGRPPLQVGTRGSDV